MEHHSKNLIDFRCFWKKFYTGKHLILVIILLSFSLWGVLDSFQDTYGDRFLGVFPIVIPGIFAIWQMLLIFGVNKEKLTSNMMWRWFAFTATVGSLPLIIANLLFVFGAWLIPANRALISNPDIYYYWWDGPGGGPGASLGSQLLLMGFSGLIIQAIASLGILLIVILPILSRRKSSVVVKGSNLEGMQNKKIQQKLASSIYTSLAIFLVGVIITASSWELNVDTNGTHTSISELIDFIQQIWMYAKFAVSEILYGIYDTEQIIWLLGVLMMIIGVLSLIWDTIQMKRAKMKDNETDE